MARAIETRCFWPPDKCNAPFSDTCIESLRKSHNVIIHVSIFCGLQYFILLRILNAKTNIVKNGITEEEHILRNISYLTAQAIEVVVRDWEYHQSEFHLHEHRTSLEIRLDTVLLPEPVVPIIASDSPGLIVKERSLIALIPVSG